MTAFLNRISRSDLEDFAEISKILLIIGVIVFFVMIIVSIITAASKAKKLADDDTKAQVALFGTIVEKHIENKSENTGMYKLEFTVEWLIFEDTYGVRHRFRNLKPSEILITAGDKGKIIVRGETVYGFYRDNYPPCFQTPDQL